MVSDVQRFGGDWTNKKLENVRKYLAAYTNALKNQPFRLIYIDAFAGTGYRTNEYTDTRQTFLFPDQVGEDAESYHAGSARIALDTDPRFADIYFIEQDPAKCRELEKLKQEFPDKVGDIHIKQMDANAFIKDICKTFMEQKYWRGVLFLDPFGMSVTWETVEAIAGTHKIDMWYLFPLGVGVNRLLKRDGDIPQGWQRRLDLIFGDPGWRDILYRKEAVPSLFDEDRKITARTGGFEQIAGYLIERLKSIFPGVAENPLYLYNSKNNPLYLLCFACGNKKGAGIALRIAEHILKES